VVGATGCGVDQTAGDTRDEEGIVDLELDGVLQGLLGRFEHTVELLGLSDCAWESVEDEAIHAVVSMLPIYVAL
jgi:hypothetical protein